MDTVKEVKKILAQYTLDVREEEFDIRAQEAAEQIWRLFQPKPLSPPKPFFHHQEGI